jgi:hypothetical protein
MTETLIDTILSRIANNNRQVGNSHYQGCLDGRIEAYEDVLRMIGYYNDDDEVIAR